MAMCAVLYFPFKSVLSPGSPGLAQRSNGTPSVEKSRECNAPTQCKKTSFLHVACVALEAAEANPGATRARWLTRAPVRVYPDLTFSKRLTQVQRLDAKKC